MRLRKAIGSAYRAGLWIHATSCANTIRSSPRPLFITWLTHELGMGTQTMRDAPPNGSARLTGRDDTLEMLQLLVVNMADYAITMLDTEGHVLTWTPAAERLKGYRTDEIIGKHYSIFFTDEDVAARKPVTELEASARDGRFEDEGWRVRKDGTRFWANEVNTALRAPDGTLRGFGRVTRDLTDRMRTEEQIRKQSQEILEMATVPVVQVWDGILLVPLIGMLDSERTQQLMERLLVRLTETGSRVALLDITGVPAIDSLTAQHLVETIKAVRFVGSEVVLTGVRPSIAQTLVHLGIDLAGVVTRSSLTAGLRVALDRLSLTVVASARGAQADHQ
jgi:rsbT co-antagonist protein RsbR